MWHAERGAWQEIAPVEGAQGLVHEGFGVLLRNPAFSYQLKGSGLWNIH